MGFITSQYCGTMTLALGANGMRRPSLRAFHTKTLNVGEADGKHTLRAILDETP